MFLRKKRNSSHNFKGLLMLTIKKLILFLTLACWAPVMQAKKSSSQPGIIILCNGTSSAGKTTLVKALHELYPEFEVFGIDAYTRTHQDLFKSWRYQNFYSLIYESARAGNNVLVDTVMYHRNHKKYSNMLSADHVRLVKVLVYCPLDCLVAHVQKRNRSGDVLELRNVNQAFCAFLGLYTIKDCSQHPVIDTMQSSQMKAALAKALATMSKSATKKYKLLEKTNRKVTEKFDLSNRSTIAIAPEHQWDLIVNTGIDNPQEVARQIYEFVEGKYGKF